MFFIFIMTAMVGGFIAGRAIGDRDGGLAFLGFGIIIVSSIANGFVGAPW